MGFFNFYRAWPWVNRILAAILIVLTLVVSIPLTIKTWREHGGPWGFGIIGLHILMPLNTYILFALAALLNRHGDQRMTFVTAHIVSVSVGIIGFMIFPILPKSILLVPALLGLLGIIDKKRLWLYLTIMLCCGIAAETVLLKWELDFGRRLPVIELFKSSQRVDING